MEEAARQRRERLAALKQNKFQKAPESDEPKQKVDDESAKTPERKRPKITAEPEITAYREIFDLNQKLKNWRVFYWHRAQDEEQEGKKFITAEEEAKKISEQLKDQVRQIQEAEVVREKYRTFHEIVDSRLYLWIRIF